MAALYLQKTDHPSQIKVFTFHRAILTTHRVSTSNLWPWRLLLYNLFNLKLTAMKLSRIILLISAALCLGYSATANTQYKMYAGFMYHFAKYTQWPTAKQSGDFVIGVIGSSDMTAATKALATTKKVGNRKIVVKSFANASEAKNCHILFVAKNKAAEISKATALSKTHNFLVITETANATTKGSTINFVADAGKIRFELSQSAVSSQGLKISSELQKLAIIKA